MNREEMYEKWLALLAEKRVFDLSIEDLDADRNALMSQIYEIEQILDAEHANDV